MNPSVNPVAIAVGAAVAGSLMLTQAAAAASNPFSMTELQNGYMVSVFSSMGETEKHGEGKCGAGKCGGAAKGSDGKCGAGYCGGDMNGSEGKCGAGSCGGNAKGGEGKCGAGKCGAS